MSGLTYRMKKVTEAVAALTEQRDRECRALAPFVNISFPSLQVDEVRLDYYPNGTAKGLLTGRERLTMDTAGALEWLAAHPGIRAQIDMFLCAEWRHALLMYPPEEWGEPHSAERCDSQANAACKTDPLMFQLYTTHGRTEVYAALEELAEFPQIIKQGV